MKYFQTYWLAVSIIFLWMPEVYADRFYIWVDDKGVTNITQNPPAPNGNLVDIVDYTNPPDIKIQSEERKTPVREQVKIPEKTDPDKIKAEYGEVFEEAAEVLEPDIYYESGSDTARRQLRKKRIEDGKNEKEEESPEDTPAKVQKERRSHKSRR